MSSIHTVAFLVRRVIVGGFFLMNGFNHFAQLNIMTGYAKSKGTPAPALAGTREPRQPRGVPRRIVGTVLAQVAWPESEASVLVDPRASVRGSLASATAVVSRTVISLPGSGWLAWGQRMEATFLHADAASDIILGIEDWS